MGILTLTEIILYGSRYCLEVWPQSVISTTEENKKSISACLPQPCKILLQRSTAASFNTGHWGFQYGWIFRGELGMGERHRDLETSVEISKTDYGFYFFFWYWELNSRPCPCSTGTPPNEPLLQSQILPPASWVPPRGPFVDIMGHLACRLSN